MASFHTNFNGLMHGSGLYFLSLFTKLPLPEVYKKHIINNCCYGRHNNQRRREIHQDIYRLINNGNNDVHVYSYVSACILDIPRIYSKFGEGPYRNYIRIYNSAFKYKRKMVFDSGSAIRGSRIFPIPDYLDVNLMVPKFTLMDIYPLYEFLKDNYSYFINIDIVDTTDDEDEDVADVNVPEIGNEVEIVAEITASTSSENAEITASTSGAIAEITAPSSSAIAEITLSTSNPICEITASTSSGSAVILCQNNEVTSESASEIPIVFEIIDDSDYDDSIIVISDSSDENEDIDEVYTVEELHRE